MLRRQPLAQTPKPCIRRVTHVRCAATLHASAHAYVYVGACVLYLCLYVRRFGDSLEPLHTHTHTHTHTHIVRETNLGPEKVATRGFEPGSRSATNASPISSKHVRSNMRELSDPRTPPPACRKARDAQTLRAARKKKRTNLPQALSAASASALQVCECW